MTPKAASASMSPSSASTGTARPGNPPTRLAATICYCWPRSLIAPTRGFTNRAEPKRAGHPPPRPARTRVWPASACPSARVSVKAGSRAREISAATCPAQAGLVRVVDHHINRANTARPMETTSTKTGDSTCQTFLCSLPVSFRRNRARSRNPTPPIASSAARPTKVGSPRQTLVARGSSAEV